MNTSVVVRGVVGGFLLTSMLGLSPLAKAQSVTNLYMSNCANCHGENGSGGGAGTQSLLRPEVRGLKGPTDRAFFDAVRNGIPETAMPAYGGDKGPLSDAQVWALVNHVRELQEAGRRKQEKAPHRRAVDGVIESAHAKYRIETVVKEGLSVPWAVDFLPPKDAAKKPDINAYAMLITERAGTLRIFENGKLSEPVSGLPKVFLRGQSGLMDVCVDPEYAGNGWVYLSYSEPASAAGGKDGGMTTIARGKLVRDGEKWKWTEMQTLWRPKPEHYVSGDIHFGSRIVVMPPIADGTNKGKQYLYFCIGERGRSEMAQDIKRPNGRVHRIFTDGTIPSDNPFTGATDQAKGWYASTWSYGHRNPQGMVMDAKGRLWDTEHGPRGGDELNLVLKGRNYGWPLVTFGINYNDTPWNVPWPDVAALKKENSADAKDGGIVGKSIAMPTLVWLPSIAACGLASAEPGPAGEAFPAWKGDLFAGGLAAQIVERVRVSDGSGEATVVEREDIIRDMGRVRDVFCGPDGAIYVALNDPDRIVRVSPVK